MVLYCIWEVTDIIKLDAIECRVIQKVVMDNLFLITLHF